MEKNTPIKKLTLDEQLHSNRKYRIVDAEGWHVAWLDDKSDGDVIVKAVNNHEQLVKTLKTLQAAAQLAIYGGDNDLYKFCELALRNINPALKQLE